MIPHSQPRFDAAFQHAATEVIHSQQLAQGDQTQQLESDIARHLKREYVWAVDSGSSALMLSIRALLKHQGGRVGIPSFACASLLFAVKAAGATPVFMDCDSSLCLEQGQAWDTIETLDILILVHPFGMVEPMIGASFPCPVIEDIAQSVGATWQGQAVGTFTDISIGSCYATKPWGGAYGGFITTQDEALSASIAAMCNPDTADIHQPYAGHHQLSNIHAALAAERILQSSKEQAQRSKLAKQYDALFQRPQTKPIHSQTGAKGNHFRYIIHTEHQAKDAIQQLQNMGIGASRPVQQPLHHAQEDTHCPNADHAWQHCISLPMSAQMSQADFAAVERGISQCL